MRDCFKQIILLAGLTLATACTQMPTEKTGVVDLRPALTFRVENTATAIARVNVDGLDMGTVDTYLEGKAVLRVLPGTHRVRVTSGGAVLLDEQMYLADGAVRALVVR